MTRYFFLTTVLLAAVGISVSAQTQWTYDMYNTVDHENFRSNPLFKQSYNSSNADIPLLNAALFFMMNEQRQKNGVYTLDYHPALEIAAYNHSKKMVEQRFFSHQNTKDRSRYSTSDRGKLAGVSNPSFAENIAYNYVSSGMTYLDVADKLIDQWMNSSGHKANILSKSAHQAGCGAYPSGNKMYGTQVFQWFGRVNETEATDKLPELKDGKDADISALKKQ